MQAVLLFSLVLLYTVFLLSFYKNLRDSWLGEIIPSLRPLTLRYTPDPVAIPLGVPKVFSLVRGAPAHRGAPPCVTHQVTLTRLPVTPQTGNPHTTGPTRP